MVRCNVLFRLLAERGICFFTGVPDSLLKDFCAYVQDHAEARSHVISANEGGAVGLACGHYLATRKLALVYMQNSGQGNATNPLVSLADPDVYGIPMLLLIGWRGEPGKKDEPQHVKQGKITLQLFDTLGIPYHILPDADDEAGKCLDQAMAQACEKGVPVALVVREGTFHPYKLQRDERVPFELTREDAVKLIVSRLSPSDIIVSTTGKASRELYECRDATDGDHSRDFLTVGSMGHASHIALGIALSKPHRQVFCLDGDGAAIMHMGGLSIIGAQPVENFKHIIINNGSHDSVGGQPTVGLKISFANIARECGYTAAFQAQNREEVIAAMDQLCRARGPALLEIKVQKGARDNLGRPKTSPKENKIKFMEFIDK